MNRLILASQSPRRRELIGLLGLPFVAKTAVVNEDSIQLIDLRQNVIERAALKGFALHQEGFADDGIIIGADTTVALDGQMLNKPVDTAHAKEMLLALRGRAHEVHTGVVLISADVSRAVRFVETAVVTMRPYSEAEIDAYIQTGDPMDKAGAYAIQHSQFNPVAALEGCYLGVMGLPICRLVTELETFGTRIKPNWQTIVQQHGAFGACPTATGADTN